MNLDVTTMKEDDVRDWVESLPEGYTWDRRFSSRSVCEICLIADLLRQHGNPGALVFCTTARRHEWSPALDLSSDLVRLIAKFDVLDRIYDRVVTREQVLEYCFD